MKRRTDAGDSFPLGPAFSMLLVGILILSALLYYRSVKIQRFLEPALALAVPRSEFSHQVMDAMAAVFGSPAIDGVNFRTNSIQIASMLVFSPEGAIHPRGSVVLKKTALAFQTVLQDDRTRPDIGSIMLIVRYPPGLTGTAARRARERSQDKGWRILDAMFAETPGLGRDFGHIFSAVAAPGAPRAAGRDDIEFRILPSERMHIEFLQKLEKYAQ
jgi:hypothetical protein